MKKTLLFYSLAIVTAATAMAGLRHTQKAPAALADKLAVGNKRVDTLGSEQSYKSIITVR